MSLAYFCPRCHLPASGCTCFPFRGRVWANIKGIARKGDVFNLRKIQCVNGFMWEEPGGWTFARDEIELLQEEE